MCVCGARAGQRDVSRDVRITVVHSSQKEHELLPLASALTTASHLQLAAGVSSTRAALTHRLFTGVCVHQHHTLRGLARRAAPARCTPPFVRCAARGRGGRNGRAPWLLRAVRPAGRGGRDGSCVTGGVPVARPGTPATPTGPQDRDGGSEPLSGARAGPWQLTRAAVLTLAKVS